MSTDFSLNTISAKEPHTQAVTKWLSPSFPRVVKDDDHHAMGKDDCLMLFFILNALVIIQSMQPNSRRISFDYLVLLKYFLGCRTLTNLLNAGNIDSGYILAKGGRNVESHLEVTPRTADGNGVHPSNPNSHRWI